MLCDVVRQLIFLNLFTQIPHADQVESEGPRGLPRHLCEMLGVARTLEMRKQDSVSVCSQLPVFFYSFEAVPMDPAHAL